VSDLYTSTISKLEPSHMKIYRERSGHTYISCFGESHTEAHQRPQLCLQGFQEKEHAHICRKKGVMKEKIQKQVIFITSGKYSVIMPIWRFQLCGHCYLCDIIPRIRNHWDVL